MDNSGQIEILATTQPVLEHELHILALHPASADNYIHLYIKDFGCGMSQSIQERIFEPFFTTKALSTKKGTGLGLSMVYELAQQMGYGLAVGSVPGKYSLFDVKIPVTGQTNPVPH
jgi:signal transduction histidine kinase